MKKLAIAAVGLTLATPAAVAGKELVLEFDEDAAGNVAFRNREKAEAIFQEVVEYWAPKAK